MSSRIITPPDNYFTANSYLIINAQDEHIDTLVLWLKTVPETYDIHLWHLYMPDTEIWALQAVLKTTVVLVNNEFIDYMSSAMRKQLSRINPVLFGKGTKYKEVIHYFLTNRP